MMNYNDKEIRHNSSKVLWEAIIYEGDGTNDTVAQEIDVHPCTDDDYKKFHEPSK